MSNVVRKFATAFAVGVFLAPFAANAATVSGISVDGALGDWGVGSPTGTNGNDWSSTQGASIAEDFVGSGGFVGPGYGGQNFDIEALFSGFDTSTNTLHVAFVTGFDIAGEMFGGTLYTAGDVFIDFGQNGSWDLAFDTSSAAGGQADARTGFTSYAETPFGVPGFPSGPFVVRDEATDGGSTETDAVSFAYANNAWGGAGEGGASDHNVYEYGYQVTNQSWLDDILGGNGFTVHWTMACGNDVLNLSVSSIPVPPPVPVPVPSAALLGLVGGLGVAIKRRRASAA